MPFFPFWSCNYKAPVGKLGKSVSNLMFWFGFDFSQYQNRDGNSLRIEKTFKFS